MHLQYSLHQKALSIIKLEKKTYFVLLSLVDFWLKEQQKNHIKELQNGIVACNYQTLPRLEVQNIVAQLEQSKAIVLIMKFLLLKLFWQDRVFLLIQTSPLQALLI